MKNFIKLILIIQLILGTSFVQAAPKDIEVDADAISSVSQETANFEHKFASAVYSVKTIPDIVKDLDDMDIAAGRAISKNMFKEIYVRLDVAFNLMTLIMLDKKLTEKQKFNLTQELASSIGEVILTLYRIHGEDKVDTNKLVKRLSEMTTVDHAKEGLKEVFFHDFKNVFIPQYSARANSLGGPEMLWGVFARLNRNELGVKATERLIQYAQDVYPKLADGKLENADVGYWKEDFAQVGQRLREYRLTGQFTTAAIYLGFAVWGILAPHVDIVALSGLSPRNDNTLFASSLIYVSFWITVALTKVAMTSTKVVKILKDLIQVLENPNQLKSEATTLKKSGPNSFMTKLSNLHQSVGNKCEVWFGRSKP